jgi:large subunit ribosomal protein L17
MRKFNRTKGDRKLFLKSVAHSLIEREHIETTLARAKEIRPMVERLLTIALKGNVASLRLLLKELPRTSALKLFRDIAPRYKERHGGSLRITANAKTRKRDGAQTAVIEFVK